MVKKIGAGEAQPDGLGKGKLELFLGGAASRKEAAGVAWECRLGPASEFFLSAMGAAAETENDETKGRGPASRVY